MKTLESAVSTMERTDGRSDGLGVAMARLRGANSMRDKVSRLTDSQVNLLLEVASGKTNAQIANDLQSQEQTVKNRLTKLMRKLEVGNRVHLATLVCLGYVPSEAQLRARWGNVHDSRWRSTRN
jgi:DNA-binding NarL/FixJ family response regulator